jgi:ABC-type Fe3+-citrate transport system substrate-binding protein
MTISTLSLSENNIDSLGNLFYGDYLQKLNIIVSTYFFSHERSNLIPYMYRELDKDNRFQLAVARVHTKIYLLRTECGRKIVVHGSANLRTSGNVEQIVFECSEDLYNFNYDWLYKLMDKSKTINKSVEAGELWRIVEAAVENQARQEARQALLKRGEVQQSQGQGPHGLICSQKV